MPTKIKDPRDSAFRKAIGGNLTDEGISKVAFAERIGSSRTAVYNWLKNPGEITLRKLRIVVHDLHFTDEDILNIIRNR